MFTAKGALVGPHAFPGSFIHANMNNKGNMGPGPMGAMFSDVSFRKQLYIQLPIATLSWMRFYVEKLPLYFSYIVG